MELPSEMPYFIVPDATLQQLKCHTPLSETYGIPDDEGVAFRRIRCGIGGNRVWHSGKSSFHLHLVQIASPVFQVAYTAVGMQFIQQVQIHIRHKNHFGIRSGFRTLAVCGGKRSRRE